MTDYLGNYKQRRVISLAPDAIIRFDSTNVSVSICDQCDAKLFLSQYITSITTSLPVNGSVGSASFTISIPRHGHEGNYLVKGGKVFGISLMQEIEIFIKGRFANPSTGERKYYKVFWGCVTNIQESYSDGFQNINVSCESILKWLQMMSTNEHPSLQFIQDNNNAALTQTMANKGVNPLPASNINYGSLGMTQKVYADSNPYEIIYSMLNITYLNIIVPDNLIDQEINASSAKDTKANFNSSAQKGVGTEKTTTPSRLSPRDVEVMAYWRKRFENPKSSLKLFGVKPSDISKQKEAAVDAQNNSKSSQVLPSQNVTVPWKIRYDSRNLMNFKPFFRIGNESGNFSYTSNSYMSNLEIINKVKNVTGFEFYLDTNGDIIFKPPFWNLNVKENKVFVIEDEDIYSWDFSEDANQVVTRVDVTGGLNVVNEITTPIPPRATYTDWNLARQFGIKSEQLSIPYFTQKNMCYFHAISELDRINSNRFSASITIVGRPELKLGYPVYIASRDMFGYVENISHSFSFGSQFTTTIELSSIRRKYVGTGSDTIQASDDSVVPSVNLRGQAVALLYKSGDKGEQANPNSSFRSNRVGYYEEKLMESSEVQALLSKIESAKKEDNQDKYLEVLDSLIPVSDEQGYELIGLYENGRSLKLTSDFKIREKVSRLGQVMIKGSAKQTNEEDKSSANYQESTDVKDSSNDSQDTLFDNEALDDFTSNAAKSISLSKLSPEGKDGSGCKCYGAIYGGLAPSVTTTQNKNTKQKKPIGNKDR